MLACGGIEISALMSSIGHGAERSFDAVQCVHGRVPVPTILRQDNLGMEVPSSLGFHFRYQPFQDGWAELERVDGCILCHFSIAGSVPDPLALLEAPTMSAGTTFVQCSQDVFRIRHPLCRLFDWVSLVVALSQLALIHVDGVNSCDLHDPFDAVFFP